MTAESINLSILLPFRVFLREEGVRSIIAESDKGSYGLLPNRLDCVLLLAPGILTYRNKEGKEQFVAVDQGVLVKTGADIRLSVRNAVDGADLGQLRLTVEQEFLRLGKEEQEMRSAVYKLESGFIRQLLKMHQT